MASSWPKHPDKALQALLKEADNKEWSVEHNKKTGYYRVRCGCGKHQKYIHKSPSDPNYERNARAWFERSGCW